MVNAVTVSATLYASCEDQDHAQGDRTNSRWSNPNRILFNPEAQIVAATSPAPGAAWNNERRVRRRKPLGLDRPAQDFSICTRHVVAVPDRPSIAMVCPVVRRNMPDHAAFGVGTTEEPGLRKASSAIRAFGQMDVDRQRKSSPRVGNSRREGVGVGNAVCAHPR